MEARVVRDYHFPKIRNVLRTRYPRVRGSCVAKFAGLQGGKCGLCQSVRRRESVESIACFTMIFVVNRLCRVEKPVW